MILGSISFEARFNTTSGFLFMCDDFDKRNFAKHLQLAYRHLKYSRTG